MRITSVAVVIACLCLGIAGPARAQSVNDFGGACNANPDFFSFAVTGLAEDTEGLGRLCGCLATEFGGLEAADYGMLIKDLEGTATAEERTAYGDYTALELKARENLDKCLVVEGFADGAEPVAGADMSAFEASCTGSALLLEIIGGDAEAATPKRDELCGCLSTTLGPQISTADAAILGRDLDGTATQQTRDAHPGYAALAEMAGVAFDTCFAGMAASLAGP